MFNVERLKIEPNVWKWKCQRSISKFKIELKGMEIEYPVTVIFNTLTLLSPFSPTFDPEDVIMSCISALLKRKGW